MAAAATATATVVERVDGAPSRAATVAARAAAPLPPIPSLPPLPMRHDPLPVHPEKRKRQRRRRQGGQRHASASTGCGAASRDGGDGCAPAAVAPREVRLTVGRRSPYRGEPARCPFTSPPHHAPAHPPPPTAAAQRQRVRGRSRGSGGGSSSDGDHPRLRWQLVVAAKAASAPPARRCAHGGAAVPPAASAGEPVPERGCPPPPPPPLTPRRAPSPGRGWMRSVKEMPVLKPPLPHFHSLDGGDPTPPPPLNRLTGAQSRRPDDGRLARRPAPAAAARCPAPCFGSIAQAQRTTRVEGRLGGGWGGRDANAHAAREGRGEGGGGGEGGTIKRGGEGAGGAAFKPASAAAPIAPQKSNPPRLCSPAPSHHKGGSRCAVRRGAAAGVFHRWV